MAKHAGPDSQLGLDNIVMEPLNLIRYTYIYLSIYLSMAYIAIMPILGGPEIFAKFSRPVMMQM